MASFNLDLEDELDVMQPVTSAPNTTSPRATNGSLDDDYVDPAQPCATNRLDWGTAKRSDRGGELPRLNATVDRVVRLAILQGFPLYESNIHWVALAGKSKRPYRCSGLPTCAACRQGDRPTTAYVTLAVQYENADSKTGKLPDDVKPIYKIGFISLSTSAFNQMIDAPAEGAKPTDVDYAMSKEPGDKGRFNFRVRGPARHIHRNETQMILNMARPYESLLEGQLGAVLPPNAVLAITPPLAPNGHNQGSIPF